MAIKLVFLNFFLTIPEASTKSFKDSEEAKAASDQQVAELTEKLDAIEAQNLRTNRVSALVDKGVDE